jgi:hypothetical protein
MLWFPWWNATGTKSPRRRIFSERTTDGRIRDWEILSGPDGLPSAFDLLVYRALEWKALEGVNDPAREISAELLLTLRDVCERCCTKEVIALEPAYRRALARLSDVRIRGPFPRERGLRPSSPSVYRAFARVSPPLVSYRANRVFEAERKVRLDPVFLRSVERRDLVPLSWEAWTSAGTDMARRLLEILSCLFAAAPGTTVPVEAASLSQLLGLERGRTCSMLEATLSTAHEDLVSSGFLADVQRDRDSGAFLYEPGVGARSVACRSGHLEPRRPEWAEVGSGRVLSWEETRSTARALA